jgi:flagellar protein FlaG
MSIETIGTNNAPSQQQVAPSRQPPEATTSSTAEQVKPLTRSTQSVQQSAPAEKADDSVGQLRAATEKMNQLMQSGNRSLRFQVDDSSDRVIIKVMDTETNEVVRQIPPEETLKFSEFLQGMVGLIFDQKA